MKPEQRARQKIDQLLEALGWIVQSREHLNLGSGPGVALSELPSPTGPADYWLFVNRQLVGAVEAKPEGYTLSSVADQSKRYMQHPPVGVPSASGPLSFGYESTGVETYFRNENDADARSLLVFSFHRPETLEAWTKKPKTLRSGLREMPSLITTGLRDCQTVAIRNLEESFALAKPRALLQMATGSGKTYTAICEAYRLLKHADARRILFLVDRRTLGKQAFREFTQYVTPDDGRKFTEIYNVQHLTSNTLDPVSQVCITTIQRLYSMLTGQPEFAEENEELSLYAVAPKAEKSLDVTYNPAIPIETFDFIITDECHRSIYNLWRQVLEYFDAFLVGLTATPSKQTFGFFKQNLVRKRHLTYEAIEQLASAIERPPINLGLEKVWDAYEQLERSKVRRAGPQKILTNIVSLLRFTLGEAEVLEPWPETVDARFQRRLKEQENVGREFTTDQIDWLKMIKDHIATTMTIEMEDFELAPFFEKGGAAKVYQIFGPDLSQILDELNEALAA